jgi:hypothetical protein
MIARSLALAILIVSSLVTAVSATAAPTAVRARHGSLQLTGDGKCAVLSHSPYLLSFGHRFAEVPAVEVTARVTDAHDSLTVVIVQKTSRYAKVEVSGQGINGQQICAASYLDWTASD